VKNVEEGRIANGQPQVVEEATIQSKAMAGRLRVGHFSIVYFPNVHVAA